MVKVIYPFLWPGVWYYLCDPKAYDIRIGSLNRIILNGKAAISEKNSAEQPEIIDVLWRPENISERL